MKALRTPLFAILILSAVTPLVRAANVTNTWASPVDGNWTNAGNWGGNAPTTNGATFLISSANSQLATTNNFATHGAFNNISFATGAGAFTVRGNPLFLSNRADASSAATTVPVNGSILNNSSAS